MKSSFHIGGFWFHVNWSADGKTGIDQHGRKWFNRDNPHSEFKITETICHTYRDLITMMAKKLITE